MKISDDLDKMRSDEEKTMHTGGGGNDEYIHEEYESNGGCKIPFLSIVILSVCIPLVGIFIYV